MNRKRAILVALSLSVSAVNLHKMGESNEGADLTTAKRALSSGFDEDREKVEAAIFFLRCEEWMMKKYMEEIRLMYLNPLNELCSGRKCTVESVSKSLEPSSSGSAQGGAAGTNKIDGAVGGGVIGTNEVAEKLQGALKTLQRGDGRDVAQNYRPVAREKTVSLADCCASYRLQALLEAVQELLDIQGSLDKWFENNKAKVDKHKGTFKNLLASALTNFEMGYVLTELFAVQQVPRQEIQKIKAGQLYIQNLRNLIIDKTCIFKSPNQFCTFSSFCSLTAREEVTVADVFFCVLQLEYSKYIRPDDDSRDTTLINKPLNKGDITSDYIRKLEGQINHFRTVVYEIARNLEVIIETVVTNVRDHRLEVNIKQLDNSQNSSANTTLSAMKSKKPKSHSLRNCPESKSRTQSVKK